MYTIIIILITIIITIIIVIIMIIRIITIIYIYACAADILLCEHMIHISCMMRDRWDLLSLWYCKTFST